LNEIMPAGKWKDSCRIGTWQEAADLCGEIASRLVYIEIEMRRDEPITNVVKLWRAIESGGYTNKLILLQAFSGHFPSKNTHRVNAEFIGEHMQESCGIRYISVPFKYRPKKGASACADYCQRAANLLAFQVRDSLQAVW